MKGSHFFHNLVHGIFLTRPNRFVVECSVKGEPLRAYLPNPGRLAELLLPGARLMLVKHGPETSRKLAYTVVAVEKDEAPVMLHTHMTNEVARTLLEKGGITGFEGVRIVKAEHRIGQSRFDFLLERDGEEMLLEVKSCTLFHGRIAMFPDAVTERGRRHLLELAKLGRDGIKTAVLFIVHSPTVDVFMPEHHTDLAFSQTLLSVRDDVMIKAVGVKWSADLRLGDEARDLLIPWDLIKRESRDQGCYIIILRLQKDQLMKIGGLGQVHFQKGWYIYVGSARMNLAKRIERHRRSRKKLHWHIDYLREHADWHAAFPIRTADDLECELAGALRGIAKWAVPGFGSSDCSCPSHLFGMPLDPLSHRAFIDLLLEFRIRRLETLPALSKHGNSR